MSGNAARFSDDRGTVVAKGNQRRMPLGESPETAPSHIVFERRMAQKVRVANAVMVAVTVSIKYRQLLNYIDSCFIIKLDECLTFCHRLRFVNSVQGR